jgi:capsular polysaccharide biosynthesis protein
MTVSPNRGSNQPEWLWATDDSEVENQSADLDTGLVSLGFIMAAIRRSVRLCAAIAAAGMLIGAGVYLSLPHAYQASTTLYLTVGPESAPGSAIADDQEIIQSRAVAGLALRKLGLRESVDSFVGSYTATPLTDRVLVITVNAPSSSEAVSQANALATEFLQYRTNQLQTQQELLFRSLDLQVTQARQQITSLSQRISQLSAQPASPARQAELSSLRAQRDQATAAVTVLVQSNNTAKADTQEATAAQIKQSQVLDAAAAIPPHGRLKHLVLYAVVGLIGALVLALSIVVIRAITSERLYRRDDVGRALGAPVKLSISKVRLSRWRPGRRGLAAARNPGIRRIVAYLRNMIAANSSGATALAVVPVDDPQVPAISLVSLAISYAEQMGLRVMVADLCRTTPAARLLGVTEAGVHTVRIDRGHMIVVVPDSEDVTPIGPLRRRAAQVKFPPCGKELVAAFDASDLLLTLAALDPSVGGDHLATWAPAAVAMITAGQSSWTRIHAASEMVRLSGTRLVSGVLIGADKTDESLGVIPTPGVDDGGRAVEEDLPDSERFFATLDKGSGGGRHGDR